MKMATKHVKADRLILGCWLSEKKWGCCGSQGRLDGLGLDVFCLAVMGVNVVEEDNTATNVDKLKDRHPKGS